ncbi:transcriptional regulator [bacterium]|nr:transcriptional regulator [bacterium]
MNQKIKFARETLRLTPNDISSLLNISSYRYSFFEKVSTDIPCDILLLLSKIYGLNPDLFILNKYSTHDILFIFEQQNFFSQSENTLEKLRFNLLQNDKVRLTYHSIKSEKKSLQDNIIRFIKTFIKVHNLSLDELALTCNINEQSLSSILSKGKFIETDELIKISNYTQTPIADIVYGTTKIL